MNEGTVNNRSAPGAFRRKPIAAESLVTFHPYSAEEPFIGVYTASSPGCKLAPWLNMHREQVLDNLLRYGAILFRHFDVRQPAELEDVIQAGSGGSLEYKFRASPRTSVSGNIFTSTDYPANEEIFPHNEHSYSPRFPLHLYFYCHQPSPVGGITPIGSNRTVLQKVLQLIPPSALEKFKEKGIMYVRNYGDGFGLPLTTVFQTDNRAQIDEFCCEQGIATIWKSDGRLTTKQTGPALVFHPQTGEELWFNHATFFHISTMPVSAQSELTRQFGPMDLPTNTFYGDGSDIEPDVLQLLRNCYRQSLVREPWLKGDVLLLDNMLAVHGRDPYQGERRILVGMAQAINSNDIAMRKE